MRVDAGPGAGGDDDEDVESVGTEHSRHVVVCDEEGDGGLRGEGTGVLGCRMRRMCWVCLFDKERGMDWV